jgi:hypothetical protein
VGLGVLLSKPALIAGGVLLVMLAGSASYGYVLSLRLDAAVAERDAARKDLEAAKAVLDETRADRDRQTAALSRQIEASREIAATSASIMRAVNAAPPSVSCAASPRVAAYLGELRRRQANALSDGASGRADNVQRRTATPRQAGR